MKNTTDVLIVRDNGFRIDAPGQSAFVRNDPDTEINMTDNVTPFAG